MSRRAREWTAAAVLAWMGLGGAGCNIVLGIEDLSGDRSGAGGGSSSHASSSASSSSSVSSSSGVLQECAWDQSSWDDCVWH